MKSYTGPPKVQFLSFFIYLHSRMGLVGRLCGWRE